VLLAGRWYDGGLVTPAGPNGAGVRHNPNACW